MKGRLSYHYLAGHSAISYIGEKYGQEKLFRFVAEHYRGKPVKDLTQELFGTPHEEFERQWAAHFASGLR